MRVAHLALDLRLRCQGCDGVDRDDVEGAGPDQKLRDLEPLLTRVGLGDEEVIDVDADSLRVGGVHGVLRVDEGTDASASLRLRDHVVDESRLAGGFRAEDLDDPAARKPSDPEGEIESERARRNGPDRDGCMVVHLHHGALAELALDLAESDVQSLLAIH